MRPSECPDCDGVGGFSHRVSYRDERRGSEDVDDGPCEACDGTGVCPPAYHGEECHGRLRYPLHGKAECAECGEEVSLRSPEVVTCQPIQ